MATRGHRKIKEVMMLIKITGESVIFVRIKVYSREPYKYKRTYLNKQIYNLQFTEDRQGAVYKIKCCDCQASYIGETGRNLSTRLTEHKRATRNGDVNNHIAEHHLQTKHQIDWDSATCITYSTDYHQRLTLESWFSNLEQTPLNRSQQLPAPYKRLIDEMKRN